LSVVIDANLLVALALNDPRAPAVDRHLREWASAGETLHAPELLRYEAANALTRTVVAGQLARPRRPGMGAHHAHQRAALQARRRRRWSSPAFVDT
jgi:predicted nucleic acid-binding protein